MARVREQVADKLQPRCEVHFLLFSFPRNIFIPHSANFYFYLITIHVGEPDNLFSYLYFCNQHILTQTTNIITFYEVLRFPPFMGITDTFFIILFLCYGVGLRCRDRYLHFYSTVGSMTGGQGENWPCITIQLDSWPANCPRVYLPVPTRVIFPAASTGLP